MDIIKVCLLLLLMAVWECRCIDSGTDKPKVLDVEIEKARQALKNALKQSSEIYPEDTAADIEKNEWYRRIQQLLKIETKDLNEDNKPMHFVTLATTLTDYKAFQQKLKVAEQNLRNLIKSINKLLKRPTLNERDKQILKQERRQLRNALKHESLSGKELIHKIESERLEKRFLDPLPPAATFDPTHTKEILDLLKKILKKINEDDYDYGDFDSIWDLLC